MCAWKTLSFPLSLSLLIRPISYSWRAWFNACGAALCAQCFCLAMAMVVVRIARTISPSCYVHALDVVYSIILACGVVYLTVWLWVAINRTAINTTTTERTTDRNYYKHFATLDTLRTPSAVAFISACSSNSGCFRWFSNENRKQTFENRMKMIKLWIVFDIFLSEVLHPQNYLPDFRNWM